MMRILLAILLSWSMTACSAQSYDPEVQVDIRASADDQARAVEATKAFGERSGFKVSSGNKLVRDGRPVTQVFMERDDGVLMAMSNFMDADVLQTTFHVKQPVADWRTVKEAWLKEVRAALGDSGEIIEVPVGPEPSLLEKKHNRDR